MMARLLSAPALTNNFVAAFFLWGLERAQHGVTEVTQPQANPHVDGPQSMHTLAHAVEVPIPPICPPFPYP